MSENNAVVAPFASLDHHDMLGNILEFCSLSDVILSIAPVCKRWFKLAFEFENYHFKKKFRYSDFRAKEFEDYCKSLTSQFTTSLDIFKPMDNAIETLVSSGSFKRLKTLSMTNSESSPEVQCRMLKLVADSDLSKNIEYLDLHRFRTDDEGLKIIAESNYFNRLKVLRTYWNGFTEESIKLLSTHPKFSRLEFIQLTDLGGDEGFKHICESPNFSNLTHLYIGQSHISNQGLGYYASSPYLKKVKVFILDRCSFDGEGIRIMCQSDNAISLEELAFEYTSIGDEGLKYIAQSPNMKNLTALDITRTDSGNEGAKYLAESPYLKKLSRLTYEHYYSEDPYYEGKYIDKEGATLLEKLNYYDNE